MSNQVRPIVFPNAGVLEYKLNKSELDYVWKCVENKKGDVKKEFGWSYNRELWIRRS